MKKQFLSLGLTAAVAASLLAGCGSSDNGAASTAASDTASTEAAAAASTEAAASEAAESSTASTEASADASNLKIGAILVGDDAVTYDKAHSDGIKAGAEANGINPDDIVFMTKVPEEAECYDKAVELIESNGCNLVISDSYGHQSYMAQAAEEYPDVNFISMTGDFAAISGLDNFYNAFDNVYESRYVSGVVAGMKIQELVDDGKLTDENYDEDGNVKVGYVGAFNYAEVVSGYTAFYLGITSVYPDAHMYVDYTNSWYDVDAEAASAEKLMSDGCVIIGQHADSTVLRPLSSRHIRTAMIMYSPSATTFLCWMLLRMSLSPLLPTTGLSATPTFSRVQQKETSRRIGLRATTKALSESPSLAPALLKARLTRLLKSKLPSRTAL